MPLDYDKAPIGPLPAAGGGPIDRAAVVSAVERYLASRGIAVAAPAAARRLPRVVRLLDARARSRHRAAVRGCERRRRSGGPLPARGRGAARPAVRRIRRLQLTGQRRRENVSSLRSADRSSRPSRWISCARPMCARRSGRSAKSISGRRRSSRRPPATWPVPLIFWCWRKAEESTVDLNLDTLKREILDYLESHGSRRLPQQPRARLEGFPMVLWDSEHYPDYQMFLEVAIKAGVKLILFATREFEAERYRRPAGAARRPRTRPRRAARLPGAPARAAHLRRRHLLAGTGLQLRFAPLRLRAAARLVRGVPDHRRRDRQRAWPTTILDEGDSLGGYFSKN